MSKLYKGTFVLLTIFFIWRVPFCSAYMSTHSFTNHPERGTHPATLVISGDEIRVDLSALPKGTEVYRAIIIPNRGGNNGISQDSLAEIKIEPTDEQGKWLKPVPPRYLTFDCTEAVKRTLVSSKKLALRIKSFPRLGSNNAIIRLDVLCNLPARHVIKQITNIQGIYRDGDTMITWKEIDPTLKKDSVTWKEFQAAKASIEKGPEVRYRIYRSRERINQATIGNSELIDEVGALTCWNPEYHGIYPKEGSLIPRLPITDNSPAPPGTGLYVHRSKEKGQYYYAVSVALDGEEDLNQLKLGENTLYEPVLEMPGRGMALLQKRENPREFYYINNPTLNYYVRWECLSTSNMPSQPFNYLVAIPPAKKEKRPLTLVLHCWGGSLNGGYLWWYGAEQGALLVSANQWPYDWWTGYHESYGTLNSFKQGKVHDYTRNRLFSFLDDFVAENYSVDKNRIYIAGGSMGGTGASILGMRNGDRFALAISGVGIHVPAKSPTFLESFEGVYGRLNWKILHDDGLPAFEYYDNVRFVRENPSKETPFISISNGKNDDSIGWEQAWEFVQALIETKRPFLFKWGQSGHGERPILPGTLHDRYLGLDIALDRTIPAFTHCSLDDDIGRSPKEGSPAGLINAYLLWEPGSSKDEKDKWEMTVFLIEKAPQNICTVNLTPRRTQKFRSKIGERFKWVNISLRDNREIQSGEIVADKWGLVTINGLRINKTKNRVKIWRLNSNQN